jgi:hypothetical protein
MGIRMSARITINITSGGEFELWMNGEGRDLLVKELQQLDERNDHFHIAPKPMGDIEASARPYRPDDKVLEWGKVLFRTDAWDLEHFPHVMESARGD